MSDYQPRAQGRPPQGGWSAQPANGQGGGQGSGQGSFSQPGYGPDYGSGYDSGYGPPPRRAPRRRRRRRGLLSLVIALVVLLVIAVIGDQVAKAYAQNRVAQQIQTSGLNRKPSVSIEGWPFLTQIASHNLQAVDISASDVTADKGNLPFSFTARATGVHLNSSFNGATIDHITGQATVTYQSLDTYLAKAIGLPGVTAITFSPDPAAGPNVVKADFGLGSVDATVSKTSPNQITIKFGSLSGIASLLGSVGAIQPQVIDIPKLPAGLVVGNPAVTSQGISIPASASNTTLTQ